MISKVQAAPATGEQTTALGLDLGSKTSSKLDGKIDNQLGQIFGLLSTAMIDANAALADALNTGSIILLVDFQTKDFTTSSAAGLSVKFGENPNPAACDANMVCGNHLKGNATFSIAADSPTDAALAGKIENGTFNSEAGDISLKIALAAGAPITLSLLHARVKASGISDTGIMTATVGGLVTQDELMTQIAPVLQGQLDGIFAAECPANAMPPNCGCTGTADVLLTTLRVDGADGSAMDCKVSAAELFAFGPVKTVLTPDSCSQDTCSAPDALSIGVKIEAVKATF
ncbi:MAG TPA: hypothetical protein VFT22_41260 [Kofleriaceae bacterium]|nr:hypothetical protein [Kofleriaceae bacterium]